MIKIILVDAVNREIRNFWHSNARLEMVVIVVFLGSCLSGCQGLLSDHVQINLTQESSSEIQMVSAPTSAKQLTAPISTSSVLPQTQSQSQNIIPPVSNEDHSNSVIPAYFNNEQPMQPASGLLQNDFLPEMIPRLDQSSFLDESTDNLPIDLDAKVASSESGWQRILHSILADHRNYYSCENLAWLGGSVGVGALMANTHFDQGVHDFFQENIRDAGTDEFFEFLHLQKSLGEGSLILPLYGISMLAGAWSEPDSRLGILGEWGERSLRSILVGGPPMLLLQHVTGGSRPGETTHDSQWVFWSDNNGVSGHAFMGAIPFITAAQMTENRWLKGFWYAASTLTAFSRVNDDAHYGSQVFLGWSMAFLAVNSVTLTENERYSVRVVSLPLSTGAGMGIEYRY